MENNKNVLVLNAWRIVWVQTLQTKGVSLRQRATRGQEPSENNAASIQIYSNQTTGTPQYPIAWQQVIVFRVWIIWRVKTACGVMVACGVGASKVVSEASEENLWRRIFYAYLYHFFLPHSHVLNFPPNDVVVELHPLLNPSISQKIGRMYGELVLMSQSLTTSLLLWGHLKTAYCVAMASTSNHGYSLILRVKMFWSLTVKWKMARNVDTGFDY